MPYSPQSFSNLEILRTPKLNQIVQNAKLIRSLSKGNNPPEQAVNGILWLNTDIASSGVMQVYSGNGFMEVETLINFTPGANLLTNGDFSLWRKNGTSLHSSSIYNDLWRYFADGWVYKSIGDDYIELQRNSFTLGQTEIPDEPQYYASIQRPDWVLNKEDTKSYLIQARIPDLRKFAGRYASFSCWLRSSLPIDLSCAAISHYGDEDIGASDDVESEGHEIVVASNWQHFDCSFLIPSLDEVTIDNTNYLGIQLSPIDIELHTLFMANVKVGDSPVSTAYVNDTQVNNIRKSEPRFYKSFDLTTTPRGNDGADKAIRTVAQANGNFAFNIPLNPNLSSYRTSSLFAFAYNPEQAIVEQEVYNVTDAVSIPVSVSVITPYCVVIQPRTLDAGNADDTIAVQLYIDADVY